MRTWSGMRANGTKLTAQQLANPLCFGIRYEAKYIIGFRTCQWDRGNQSDRWGSREKLMTGRHLRKPGEQEETPQPAQA